MLTIGKTTVAGQKSIKGNVRLLDLNNTNAPKQILKRVYF